MLHNKRYPPIIISIIILIIGLVAVLKIYDNWRSEEITINNPTVHEVTNDSTSMDLKTIIHEAEKSVVQIEGQNEFSKITGSGFLYNEKGDIITNAHVIQNADAISIRTSNAEIYPAAVIGVSEEVDVAVIRVPQLAGLSPLPVAEESLAEIGDEVIALGSPHGFQNTVTLGIISGTERNFSVEGYDYSNVYQISAQISQGNSGGPLIKRDTGEIIGINSVGTQDGTIGFSIPIVDIIDQVTQWSNEAQNDQLEFSSVTDLISFSDSDEVIENAEYVTSYFLESISVRDYVGAYTLLGSSTQLELTYQEFRDRFINIISLEFSDLDSSIIENNRIQTSVEVTVEQNIPQEEDTFKETHTFVFTVGYENDQLKILDYSSPDR
ncbi:S1C family serine protease [Oceanobacillus damuensis]|uniref:S1C family serine protease n=1 Tax=Oceanobacillus damuensis TaxID=937928 RepID=UPI00082FDEE6|nr:S1C family serine protease [Oceanobacillus damuensis]